MARSTPYLALLPFLATVFACQPPPPPRHGVPERDSTQPADAAPEASATEAAATMATATSDAASDAPALTARSAIACKVDDDCWVERGAPIARPAELRGKAFVHCLDGEYQPVCLSTGCATITSPCPRRRYD